MSLYDQILHHLDSQGIQYRTVHHEPTRTSEESAKARGVDIAIGGKAILMKVGDEFKLFVFSAAKRIDSQKIRSHFNVKKIRFATPEELLQHTGLVPGSVPPFGKPILPFGLFVDESITRNDEMAFNAGSLTDSIIMRTNDYLNVAAPSVFLFVED